MSIAYAYDHTGPWTADDVMALPEDGNRYEALGGSLLVSPPPCRPHQRASHRLHCLLEDAVTTAGIGTPIWEAVGVRLPHNQLVVPDLVVGMPGTEEEAKPLLDPDDVLLLVEIVSPGSTTADRRAKPAAYAEAGIRYYWRVELENFRGRAEDLPVLFAHELHAGREYHQTHRVGAGVLAWLDRPFDISFDPAWLLSRKIVR